MWPIYGKTKLTQRGEVSFLRPHSQYLAELEFKPVSIMPLPKFVIFTFYWKNLW